DYYCFSYRIGSTSEVF
nr:immunoglobulin light chain junction region [Macaca mulatta]